MARPLVIDCHVPFAPRLAVLAELFTDEVLGLFQQFDLRATFLLSGLFLQRLEKNRGMLGPLKALVEDGRVEVALEPLGAPLPGQEGVADILSRTELAVQWFRELTGMTPGAVLLDARYPCRELLSTPPISALPHVVCTTLFPRETLARRTLSLRSTSGSPQLSFLNEMSGIHEVTQTAEQLALAPLAALPEHDRRIVLKNLKDWLRGEDGKTNHLADSAGAAASGSTDELFRLFGSVRKLERTTPEPPALQRYTERVEALSADVGRYWKQTDSGVANESRSRRQQEIARHMAQARAGDGLLVAPERGFLNPRAREMLYDGLLRAQVAFDAERRPDVDPNVGWVEIISPLGTRGEVRDALVVDTQLLRLYVDPATGGCLRSFEYRPRKINLQSVLGSDGDTVPSFVERLVRIGPGMPPTKEFAVQSFCEEMRVTQRTGGVAITRMINRVGEKDQIRIQKELLVRSGIGAHLSNSTTGFSLEYSLEDPAAVHPEHHLVIQCAVLLPSAEPSAASLYPLMCVGGVSSTRESFAESKAIAGDAVPGGLYGARLIDTLQDFMMDFRASRPLWGMFVEPVYLEQIAGKRIYQGSILSLVVPCSRLKGGLSGFSLFVSIM